MYQSRFSLKTRLLIWFMGGLILLSGLMLIEMQQSAKTAANRAYDRVLYGSALAISETAIIVGNEIEVDIPPVSLEMLASTAQDRVFYQVSDSSKRFITGYDDLPDPEQEFKAHKAHLPLTSRDQVSFYDSYYHGEAIRVARVRKYLSNPNQSTHIIIKVAETTQARTILIEEMLYEALFQQVVLIIVAALILWVGVSWGLRPLRRLKDALEERSPKDLHPINYKLPEELQVLVEGINDLMARLSTNITAMRQFTGNAAHQLRTPLAAIQTQTELALKSDDPNDLQYRLHHLRQATSQSTRLINQLLSLAQAASPAEAKAEMQRVDLVTLCQQQIRQKVPDALKAGIDLGFETDLTTAPIAGNENLLEEALKNLLHNALIYCPSQTIVTVRLRLGGFQDQIILEVEDTGPGISPEHLPKIFNRFERAGRSDGDGCGLGLPIVREIIHGHAGRITLESHLEKGTKITATLPKLTDS